MLTLLLTQVDKLLAEQVMWREGGVRVGGVRVGGCTSKKLSKCSCSSSGDTGKENKIASLLSVIYVA